MIYRLLKLIVRCSVQLFFRKIHVDGRENLTFREPCIIVSNHPNTLLDALVIARMLRQQIYFLANASLFDTPLKSRVMYAVNMIPIYRKQDMQKEGQKTGNRSAFIRCFEFLERKKTILIFPEGTSFNERHLRDIKTGTARIAFGAEAQQDFALNLKIIPMGLNYTDPTRFFGNLYISIGKPITLQKYKKSYQENSRNAVSELTEEIRQSIASKMINTKDKAQDVWIHKIENSYKNRLAEHLQQPISDLRSEFLLTQKIVRSMQHTIQTYPRKLTELNALMQEYETYLQKQKLKNATLEMAQKYSATSGHIYVYTLGLLVGFPIFLYGFLNNMTLYLIPRIADKIVKEVEYRSSIIFILGILAFIFYCTIQVVLFYHFTTHKLYTLLYFISLIPSGLFAYWYYQKWNQLISLQRFIFFKKNKKEAQKLLQLRNKLFRLLDELIL